MRVSDVLTKMQKAGVIDCSVSAGQNATTIAIADGESIDILARKGPQYWTNKGDVSAYYDYSVRSFNCWMDDNEIFICVDTKTCKEAPEWVN